MLMAAEKIRKKIFRLCPEIFPKEIHRNLAKCQRENPEYQPPDLDFLKATTATRSEVKSTQPAMK